MKLFHRPWWLLACALILLLVSCAPPQTPGSLSSGEPSRLAGVLPGRTVLAGEVVIEDDVLVPVGSVLVIEAGTVIRVRSSEGTRIDPEYLSPMTELLVRGTIEVRGTAQEPVRFEPLEPAPEEGVSWAGIELDGASGSRITSARILAADTGILCIGSSPRLEKNHLAGCRYGVIAQHGSAPAILENRIEGGEGGVFCWDGSSPTLKGNRIEGNDEEGIFVDRSSRPVLDRNLVTGNGIGLALFPADLPYDPSGIDGNRVDILRLGSAPGRQR